MFINISVQDAFDESCLIAHLIAKQNDVPFNHPDPFGGDLLQQSRR